MLPRPLAVFLWVAILLNDNLPATKLALKPRSELFPTIE